MNPRQRLVRQVVAAVTVLSLLAYVPALLAAPGRMPADSKLYLYLDPGRFLGDAASSFDPRQFAGWVPHQHVAYLWPSGPWFWLFDTVGVPDWIAHRLWIGSLMLAAGLGVRWCARQLGFGQTAALVAAVVYQTSPYVLPYVSRTSVMLLPWAGLGWIVGLTIRATRRRTWHDPALIALVVFTVGAVNATALAMIVPAPVLWLVHAVWQRSITGRQALAVAVRVVVLTVPVCLWWIMMLIIQGRSGAEVLPYSESLADVSVTATGSEIWRSLGYWLFYVRDPYAAATTESLRYLSSTPAIVISYLVPLVCVAGLVVTRWAHRRFALLLVGAGAVLAVGVHPVDDRSPLMRVLAGDDDGGLALALRSSTRALPVMNLGLALGGAALVAACAGMRLPRLGWRTNWAAAAAVVLIAVVNLPALWNGGFVDPALERDQDPPAAWLDAAEALDVGGARGRVLQVPGVEFGAYLWGYTVDQPLPGLTETPLVTRDLLPLGSPGAMDLLYALDDRMQEGVFEPASLPAVARWLGADTVWITNDLAFDRFRTARPQVVGAQIDEATGVAGSVQFGQVAPPSTTFEMIDEASIGDPRATAPVAPIALHGLDPPGSIVRAADEVVVASGSADGLVDLAAAGLVDGTEVVRYTASIAGDDLPGVLADAGVLMVTDSNRDRARHWRSSQDTVGYTESDQFGLDLLREVASDQRLPVFADRDAAVDPATQTVARQVGPVTATATSYGEPFAYLPEHRPMMAIDGDSTTAWMVGEHADPVGEVLRLRFDAPVDQIGIVQPDPGDGRRITEVIVRSDDRPAERVLLDDRSLTPAGMPVPVGGAAVVDIEIAAVAGGEPFTAGAVAPVGVAEVVTGLVQTVEVVRPPHDGLEAVAADTDLVIALTRLRTDPMDRWRDDPEPALSRELELATPRAFDVGVEVRVDRRAPDAELAEAFGWPAVASTRLTGSIANAGVAAIDGDPATAWATAFGDPVGATLTIDGVAEPVDEISVRQPPGTFSTITALTLRSAGEERTVEVAPAADRAVTIAIDPPLPPGRIEVVIAAIDPTTARDRRFGDIVELPAAIAEIALPGRPPVAGVAETELTIECRALLAIDGDDRRFTVSITGADAIAGRPATVAPCDGPLDAAAGTHRITTVPIALPLTVDRVVLDDRAERDGAAGRSPEEAPAAVQVAGDSFRRSIDVTGCRSGCWFVLGEGYNTAWHASVDGVALGAPQLVDGGFNGWWLTPTEGVIRVDVEWTEQGDLALALALSAIGVAVAIAVAVATRRPAGPPVMARRPRWVWNGPPRRVVPSRDTGRRWSFATTSTVLVVSWTVLAGLLIQPEWAVWGAVAGFGAALWQRPRLPELTGLAALLVVAVLVVVRERRNAPAPGGGWPLVFESLHGLALFAVVSLIVGAMVADDDDHAGHPDEW